MSLAQSEVIFEKVIVHEVEKSLKREDSTKLSTGLSPLTKEVREFFEKRTAVAFNEAGVNVRHREGTDSPIPTLSRELIARPFKEQIFIQKSQESATHLSKVQGKSASEGLLVVAQAKIRSCPALVFVKLEKSGGIRAKPHGSGGSLVLHLEHIEDLLLTDKMKVFKVAIFSEIGEDDLQIEVCDNQNPLTVGKLVSNFFLHDFLGCEFLREPKILTQDFLLTTQAFSAKHLTTPEARTKFHLAVINALSSNAKQIRVKEFAQNHIAPKLQDEFVNSVKSKDIPLAFAKDTSLVEPVLKKMCMTFADGLALVGDPGAFQKDVKHTKDGVLVKSEVENVGHKK